MVVLLQGLYLTEYYITLRVKRISEIRYYSVYVYISEILKQFCIRLAHNLFMDGRNSSSRGIYVDRAKLIRFTRLCLDRG